MVILEALFIFLRFSNWFVLCGFSFLLALLVLKSLLSSGLIPDLRISFLVFFIKPSSFQLIFITQDLFLALRQRIPFLDDLTHNLRFSLPRELMLHPVKHLPGKLSVHFPLVSRHFHLYLNLIVWQTDIDLNAMFWRENTNRRQDCITEPT